MAAYHQRDDLTAVIDQLREAAADPDYEDCLGQATAFIAPEVLAALRAVPAGRFDLRKLVASAKSWTTPTAGATTCRPSCS